MSTWFHTERCGNSDISKELRCLRYGARAQWSAKRICEFQILLYLAALANPKDASAMYFAIENTARAFVTALAKVSRESDLLCFVHPRFHQQVVVLFDVAVKFVFASSCSPYPPPVDIPVLLMPGTMA